MSDPHKNIFYYYRGPSSKKDNNLDEIIYDRQVEDNTTKALINFFEYSSISLLHHFIQYFQIKVKNISTPKFLLQVSMARSRPDAVIKFVNSAIYIENKVGAPVDLRQILNHMETMEKNDSLVLITNNNDDHAIIRVLDIIYINWNEIYRCFKHYIPVNINEKFLKEQFLSYLEVMGLSDFNGFKKDDFDFFINCIDDYKPVIRNKIEKFGNLVYEQLSAEIKSIYNDRYVGNISKNPQLVWFGIRKDKSIKDVFKHCNFVLEINSDNLKLYSVIRDGRYNQNKPVGILYKKIKDNPDYFISLLGSLGKDYYLDVSKRVPKSGNKILPGNEKWELVSLFKLEFLTNETIDYLLMLLKNIDFPGIRIGRDIKRGEKILQEPENLINFVKVVIENEFNILKFLES